MRSPQYEHALTKQGLTFSYVEKERLDNIDGPRSLRNQARLLTPIDEELVSSYEEVYRNVPIGEETPFPPLVAFRPGKRSDCKLTLIDGNQRFTAAGKAGRKVHDIYLVECQDSIIIDRVTWIFNNLVNGKRITPEECIEHALTLINKYAMPVNAAAKECGVKLGTLTKRLHAQKVSQVLERQQVKKSSTLTPERLNDLAPLLQVGEDVLARAATLVVEAGLNGNDTCELVTIVKRAPTVKDKLQAIETLANSEAVKVRRAETKGGTIKPPRIEPRDNLARLIQQANRLFDNFSDRVALKPRALDWKVQRQAATDLIEHLALLFGLGAMHKDLVNGEVVEVVSSVTDKEDSKGG